MELIDTHCHAHFNAYKDEADKIVRESLDAGVGLITVGTQKTTSENAVKLAERYDGVWAAVGLHPSHLFEGYVDEDEVQFKSRNETFDPAFYRALARHPKTVAIGEMGLDYHYEYEGVDLGQMKRRELETFVAGAALAKEEGLPLIIHCRDAYEDQFAAIEGAYGPYKKGSALRGVAHCFTGTKAQAQRYFDLGFMISFTGTITYPPRKADLAAGAETAAEVVRWAPLEMIMVETDAPYLAPAPYRGKRNHPMWVRYVAAKIAELKGLPLEQVAEATTRNAKALFAKMQP